MQSNELNILQNDDPNPEPALPRPIRIGLLTCLVSALGVYVIAHSLISRLHVWWMEALVYALIPLSATFIVLYRSRWRREISGTARTSRLLLLSCAIAGGEVIAAFAAAAIILCMGLLCMALVAFCANAFTGGNH
jgi:hypothetical protein